MTFRVGVTLAACIVSAVFPINTAVASSQAAKELVNQFKITTYTATRKDSDFYELTEGFVVKTKYCYVYGYYTPVVIVNDKLIFIDEDQVCDIEGIYRK
jgi:hypothetical protein